MTFELELGESRLWCSSADCVRMLVQKGARLANPAQAEDLQRILESTEAPAVQNESNRE